MGAFCVPSDIEKIKKVCCRRVLRRDDSSARIGRKVGTIAFLKLIILPLSYSFMRKCFTNSGPNHNPQSHKTHLSLKYGSSHTKFLHQRLKKVIYCCKRLLRGDHLTARIGNNLVWPISPTLLLGHAKMLYKLRNRKNPQKDHNLTRNYNCSCRTKLIPPSFTIAMSSLKSSNPTYSSSKAAPLKATHKKHHKSTTYTAASLA